jgi:hypothetical protein
VNSPKDRRRQVLEYLSTAVAVIVSLASLWVAIGSENANRQMVAAASWPILMVESGNVGADARQLELHFKVTNSGVGPAKVRSFEIFYKGKAYRSSTALMRACCDSHFAGAESLKVSELAGWDFVTGTIAGGVIRAGESKGFITYAFDARHAAAWHALDLARQRSVSYRLCYCSVFDECWINTIGRGHQLDPARVRACPVPPVPYGE